MGEDAIWHQRGLHFELLFIHDDVGFDLAVTGNRPAVRTDVQAAPLRVLDLRLHRIFALFRLILAARKGVLCLK